MKVLLSRTFHVITDELERHLDAVMAALLELESERLCDADLSATLEDGVVQISVVASSGLQDESEALGDAVTHADAAIRAAIHAAGGHTPSWQHVSMDIEELETV